MTEKQIARKRRHQMIMDLYGDLDKPAREIAEIVGVTPKTVWWIIRQNLSAKERMERDENHKRKLHYNFGKVKHK